MRTDDENYEYGGIYEDEADEYIDGDEIEVFDYPEDDEDKNALWDDEDTADTDEPPERKRRKRKKEIVLDNTEDADDELSEKTQRQIAKERRLIDEIEADAEEHPIEDDEDSTEEQPERKLLKRELRAQALARLEDAAGHKEISRMSLHGGTSWMPTENARSVITSFPAAAMMFPLTMGRQKMVCSSQTP